MKKFMLAMIASLTCVTAAPSFAEFNLAAAFPVKTANATCPADNTDIGNGGSAPSAQWCSAYLNQAVEECNATCVVRPVPCQAGTLSSMIHSSVGQSVNICQQQCARHYLPGLPSAFSPARCGQAGTAENAAVNTCILRWEEYAGTPGVSSGCPIA